MTLSLTCQRFSWEHVRYAFPGRSQAEGAALDDVFRALRGGGHCADLVAVKMPETVARAVVASLKAANRTRSAEAIERAIRLAKSKEADDDGLSERREVLAMLDSEGDLTPAERAAAERLGLFK